MQRTTEERVEEVAGPSRNAPLMGGVAVSRGPEAVADLDEGSSAKRLAGSSAAAKALSSQRIK